MQSPTLDDHPSMMVELLVLTTLSLLLVSKTMLLIAHWSCYKNKATIKSLLLQKFCTWSSRLQWYRWQLEEQCLCHDTQQTLSLYFLLSLCNCSWQFSLFYTNKSQRYKCSHISNITVKRSNLFNCTCEKPLDENDIKVLFSCSVLVLLNKYVSDTFQGNSWLSQELFSRLLVVTTATAVISTVVPLLESFLYWFLHHPYVHCLVIPWANAWHVLIYSHFLSLHIASIPCLVLYPLFHDSQLVLHKTVLTSSKAGSYSVIASEKITPAQLFNLVTFTTLIETLVNAFDFLAMDPANSLVSKISAMLVAFASTHLIEWDMKPYNKRNHDWITFCILQVGVSL